MSEHVQNTWYTAKQMIYLQRTEIYSICKAFYHGYGYYEWY